MYAWSENGKIYVSKKPFGKNVIEVPDNVSPIHLFINENGEIQFRSEDELILYEKNKRQEELLQVEKGRVQKILDSYGYISLGDIQFYASQNDTEAQAILNWYQSYDDLIWSYIDNDLSAFTNLDELLAVDMKNIEEQIYQQSILQSPLP